MPRKRIMQEFRINEISSVDSPAQEEARVAIMKRAEPRENNLPMVRTLWPSTPPCWRTWLSAKSRKAWEP